METSTQLKLFLRTLGLFPIRAYFFQLCVFLIVCWDYTVIGLVERF